MRLQTKHIAALDLGSNSFHILIAKVEAGKIAFVYREKQPMRVSDERGEYDYAISRKKISEAVDLIKYFKGVADKYSAEIFAVATSAIREAKNRTEFIHEVSNQTGISVQIVTGEEEGELALLSLQYSFKKLPSRYLLFDLGGGSTEFIFVENDRIEKKFSIPIGAVRYTNKFSTLHDGNIDLAEGLTVLAKKEISLVKEFASSFQFEKCYGMGGTVSAISMMIEKSVFKRDVKYEQLRGYNFSINELRKVISIVEAAKDISEKKKIAGLEETRADIVMAGLLIVKTFFEELRIDSITFAWTGLREGIIMKAIKG
ncbi:MAG: exopolyphosphatase [Stygiobacter sp.]|nr:MAG: exopolyphosphatase [Stygiobacter sp.]